MALGPTFLIEDEASFRGPPEIALGAEGGCAFPNEVGHVDCVTAHDGGTGTLATRGDSVQVGCMITVIAGTNRDGSNTLKVAKAVAEMHRGMGAEVTLLDLVALPSSILGPGAYAEKPDGFAEAFQRPVLDANGLVVVTPEYNGGFPGVLKLFIDMLPFPESFENRPTAYIGLSAGSGGALRPVEQLQMIFGYRNALNYNKRVFMPSVDDLLNESGAIVDGGLRERLMDQARGFQAFVESVRPVEKVRNNG